MEWFDEEYANVNKETNAARERATSISKPEEPRMLTN
jgi:hypothetical protein